MDVDPQMHLQGLRLAAQKRAEKRSRALMLELKQQLSATFTMSGVSLEQQFRAFDANHDGEIDHQEFKDGLAGLGATLSMQQLEDLITILDTDGDGSIDYQEFARWFGAGPPPPPVMPEMKARDEAKVRPRDAPHAAPSQDAPL